MNSYVVPRGCVARDATRWVHIRGATKNDEIHNPPADNHPGSIMSNSVESLQGLDLSFKLLITVLASLPSDVSQVRHLGPLGNRSRGGHRLKGVGRSASD